jgi:predicted lipoprotein with Yx(FWY)xxD motif
VKKLLTAATVLLAAIVVFAACGGGGGGKKETKKPTTTKSTPATTAAPAAAATVKTAQTGIGTVLVDPDGKTLYLFANDQGTTSAVPANIRQAWPPLTVTGAPVAGAGLDKSKLGTAPQPDGQTWVTYNGHLLYRFSGDASAGQTNGHKLGNVWYAVTAAGERAP